jgi:hypothetical protein
LLHVLGWAILGLLCGAAAWLLRPKVWSMRLLGLLPLSVAGALFGGFVSWIFWDFPGTVDSERELFSMPALVSDGLAIFGALVAVSMATGVVVFENMNDRRRRRQ